MPRKGLGTLGPAPYTRGRSIASTQAKVSTGDCFAPQMHWHSALLCSRFEGETGMHPEHCYATFIPTLEQVMNFLVQNFSAQIHTSRNVKKLGMSEQSLKMNQRGHQGGGKFD